MRLEEAGVIWTHPRQCAPLDDLKIEFKWNELNGQAVRFEITDANHVMYYEQTVNSKEGQAEITIKPGRVLGVHHVELWTTKQDGSEYCRHGGFRVETTTRLETDKKEFNELFAQIEEGLRQTVDVTLVDGTPTTHYKHGDNTRQNIAYPLYAFAGYRYFVSDMKSAFEALFAYQYPDGSLPDHIYGDDYPCPFAGRRLRSCMADMEIAAVTTIYKSWQAHGDDQWIEKRMLALEAGIEHTVTDPMKFDKGYGVIKRTHTLDLWDIQFSDLGVCGDEVDENSRFVINQGDTSTMYDACRSLFIIYESLNNSARAGYWKMMENHFLKLGNDIFWDGVKYRHHIHLDSFDHGCFDEDDQLAMSNAFAMNRSDFVDHAKAVSIINEYMRRLKETGDRFPWWSLQPGYPDELNYFEGADPWKRAQGNYVNGGLIPWVGAELCSGAFKHGKEELAVQLLEDFYGVIQRDNGGTFTWYDLDGNAHISAEHNQTSDDTWALFGWAQALIEGLAGIQSAGKCFEKVLCSPKWASSDCKKTTTVAHFPASESYFAYDYNLMENDIDLHFTGTGEKVSFSILLPKGKRCSNVRIDGEKVGFENETIEESLYVVVDTHITGTHQLIVTFA